MHVEKNPWSTCIFLPATRCSFWVYVGIRYRQVRQRFCLCTTRWQGKCWETLAPPIRHGNLYNRNVTKCFYRKLKKCYIHIFTELTSTYHASNVSKSRRILGWSNFDIKAISNPRQRQHWLHLNCRNRTKETYGHSSQLVGIWRYSEDQFMTSKIWYDRMKAIKGHNIRSVSVLTDRIFGT